MRIATQAIILVFMSLATACGAEELIQEQESTPAPVAARSSLSTDQIAMPPTIEGEAHVDESLIDAANGDESDCARREPPVPQCANWDGTHEDLPYDDIDGPPGEEFSVPTPLGCIYGTSSSGRKVLFCNISYYYDDLCKAPYADFELAAPESMDAEPAYRVRGAWKAVHSYRRSGDLFTRTLDQMFPATWTRPADGLPRPLPPDLPTTPLYKCKLQVGSIYNGALVMDLDYAQKFHQELILSTTTDEDGGAMTIVFNFSASGSAMAAANGPLQEAQTTLYAGFGSIPPASTGEDPAVTVEKLVNGNPDSANVDDSKSVEQLKDEWEDLKKELDEVVASYPNYSIEATSSSTSGSGTSYSDYELRHQQAASAEQAARDTLSGRMFRLHAAQQEQASIYRQISMGAHDHAMGTLGATEGALQGYFVRAGASVAFHPAAVSGGDWELQGLAN